MHGGILRSRPAFGGLIRVRTTRDIEYLVKEAEVLTGRRGRDFVVCGGADRLAYRVLWYENGYEVQRLGPAGDPTSAMLLLPEMLDQHCFGSALRAGCLFTPVVAE